MRFELKDRLKETQRVLEVASNSGTVCISMSAGMDSVTMADLAVKSGIPIKLVHLYMIRDLPCDTVILDEMQDRWKTEIHKIPHPARNLMIWTRALSTEGAEELINGTDQFIERIPSKDFDKFNRDMTAYFDCHYVAVAFLRSDGIRRLTAMQVNPRPLSRKVYPLSLWTFKDVKEYHADNNIPISPSYRLFGCSYDAFGLCHSYPMKAGHTESWKAIIRDFPYIELQAELYEKRVSLGLIAPTVKGEIIW